jgi:uncharacterized protein
MRLKLWVSAQEADDLDLFVTLHRIGRDGREVFFSGYIAPITLLQNWNPAAKK